MLLRLVRFSGQNQSGQHQNENCPRKSRFSVPVRQERVEWGEEGEDAGRAGRLPGSRASSAASEACSFLVWPRLSLRWSTSFCPPGLCDEIRVQHVWQLHSGEVEVQCGQWSLASWDSIWETDKRKVGVRGCGLGAEAFYGAREVARVLSTPTPHLWKWALLQLLTGSLLQPGTLQNILTWGCPASWKLLRGPQKPHLKEAKPRSLHVSTHG